MNCEIEDCNGAGVVDMSGVYVCERCRQGYVSARPWGAVHFDGGWHGVRGATYPPDVAAAFPGLPAKAEEDPR